MTTLQRFRSTKSFWNFPCAHRQHRHPGHCKWVHGYSRSFHFLFESYALDPCGFVQDFSDLHELKGWLDENFDHTLLINPDDPLISEFQKLNAFDACKLVIVPTGVSMEGTARWVYETWAPQIEQRSNGDVWLVQVEVRENDKNSGLYIRERV